MFLAELQAACCRLHGCGCFIPAPAAVVQLSHTFGLLFLVLLQFWHYNKFFPPCSSIIYMTI
jgi:hypothetical protein